MASREVDEVRLRLPELRRMLAASMTDEQRLYQRFADAQREAERWRTRAELALGRSADDLARAALERADREASRAAQHHAQYLDQKAYVESMKAKLSELEIRSRGGSVITTSVDTRKLEQTLARLRRQEERLADERARAAALAELERDELTEKLAALEREDRLERDLGELKAKLGMEDQG